MTRGRNAAAAGPLTSRSKCTRCAILALAAGALFVGTACDEEAAGRAFRDAASTSFQAGLNSIMDGLVDGMFAVFELGVDQDTTGTGGTSSGGE